LETLRDVDHITIEQCKTWGFHDDEDSSHHLLGCDSILPLHNMSQPRRLQLEPLGKSYVQLEVAGPNLKSDYFHMIL